MPQDVEAIAEQVFSALADPTRRAILAELASGGPATATDLAARLPITRQAVAKHLAPLAQARLVTAEPGERRRVRYRVRWAPVRAAQRFLAARARDWDCTLGPRPDPLTRGCLATTRPACPQAPGRHFANQRTPGLTTEATMNAEPQTAAPPAARGAGVPALT